MRFLILLAALVAVDAGAAGAAEARAPGEAVEPVKAGGES